MTITKMHGLGNDFIVIDNREEALNGPALAKKLCARRLSVGADGLLLVENSRVADIRMRIINADGSEAEMCGNGIRCFARFVYDAGIVGKSAFSVETLAGIMRPSLILEQGAVRGVRVDMGMPSFAAEDVPVAAKEGNTLRRTIEAAGKTLTISSLRMGVPHTVVPVEGAVSFADLPVLGPAVETHPIFPQKTNVNFAKLVDTDTIEVRTWERGAGPTLACGTGSCATACAYYAQGKVGRQVTIRLAAGSLLIDIAQDGRVFMTGPAEYVFTGELTQP